jgi:hypothetical protein
MTEQEIDELASLWVANRGKHKAEEIMQLPLIIIKRLMETDQLTVREYEVMRLYLTQLRERSNP